MSLLPPGAEPRHHIVRLKGSTQLVASRHRRPPHGTGVVYMQTLTEEIEIWCRDRGIPEPVLTGDPENPGGFALVFENRDHAFEFKLRWYTNE
jgi:hypothetical protein